MKGSFTLKENFKKFFLLPLTSSLEKYFQTREKEDGTVTSYRLRFALLSIFPRRNRSHCGNERWTRE